MSDGGSTTRVLVVRLTNPAGHRLDDAAFPDLEALGRRLAVEPASATW